MKTPQADNSSSRGGRCSRASCVVRVRVRGIVDAPDVWIGFHAIDRRRHGWRNGMRTSALVGVVAATILTATGLQFRTFVSRRVAPWNEVAGRERRQRVTGSGVWSDLRVVRVRGCSLGIAGSVTDPMTDAELERKRVAVQECWSRAVGG
ncbi:hypothetical protein [Streptomyces sp. NPDC085529]|uniref:hypothetical protein n=1 Tax=Streptomyces sp. NPDC085529 TaxID=3365729 RepID=UPI0037D92B4F